MTQFDRQSGARAESGPHRGRPSERLESNPPTGEPRDAVRSTGWAPLLVTLGVGGMLLLFLAAHLSPAHSGALQVGAVLWFLGVGLLKVVFDLRSRV